MLVKPFLLYSDGEGNIYEDETLYAVGRAGWDAFPVESDQWIELPQGGNLYELPGRRGIGIDVETGEMRLCEKGWAVAAFIPPAYTGLFIAAYETMPDAPTLPLFCYTAVGWMDEKNYVPAVRIEKDIRQEAAGFDDTKVKEGTSHLLQAYPENRLVKHLMENCCMTYHCPAARNFSLGRWECPVPTSPACNANCIGCISFQPEEETIVSTQDRLTFKPMAEEIVEFTVPHLINAPFPIISFGQGCEGEPLLMWETIKESIIEIRKHTNRGSININTNGSKPAAVDALCKAGLNSMRVSTNSAQKHIYEAYYRPNNYAFEDIIESLKVMRSYGGWTSINYFVFPGITDSEAEYEALRKLISDTNLNMIQWRNFNIDPDWYMGKIGMTDTGEMLGVKQMMDLIQDEFPNVKFGYFNPPMERIKGDYNHQFAGAPLQ
ncbi:MAG: radical SAM protein [Sphingobacteriia bacterium 24-36-13]|jgi:wyosine [tRNA(Phe)-imidazoG37] synthetase (radical SAM superfamily)|uniref:radical SAM protein n=1 Tax=Sediminibacterium sp. TaxID=1917865 RepID=UPI000BCA36C5|nr:radical SAM protein [Sediminibacterium sp.]OYY11431.1 MAG: radical SAM protein [Sphingobacteriia bacterium 35-36-14]OYZ55519.1 MAG: radical SAM protein [Sphingobacteriia bacterium 24-36-13]OZA66025.1 MAG: radical SAM protein [Sphingobacteriia bacterium 39-36-14]HQS23518.1 radical SAM protein [Sediminibacterium sp.]HQS34264.1 radical SAM protein [Sediminibacterium sp.]